MFAPVNIQECDLLQVKVTYAKQYCGGAGFCIACLSVHWRMYDALFEATALIRKLF